MLIPIVRAELRTDHRIYYTMAPTDDDDDDTGRSPPGVRVRFRRPKKLYQLPGTHLGIRTRRRKRAPPPTGRRFTMYRYAVIGGDATRVISECRLSSRSEEIVRNNRRRKSISDFRFSGRFRSERRTFEIVGPAAGVSRDGDPSESVFHERGMVQSAAKNAVHPPRTSESNR